MRRFVLALTVAVLALPGPVLAQGEQTLADIRQELSVLYVEMKKLKRELSTTGGVSGQQFSGSTLDRVGAMETQLQRLTSKTEEMEHRIDKVVTDGTNRVEDLEFRVCELDPDCDISTLKPGETLGGGEAPAGGGTAPTVIAPAGGGDASGDSASVDTEGMQLAVAEKDDFEAAKAAFDNGNYSEAAALFEKFRQTYPGGPLSGKAGLLQGQALEQTGQMKQAGNAYLKVFSDNKEGPDAPAALRRLGEALGALGQTEQACITLGEVGNRFPESGEISAAQSALSRLGCS